MKHLTPIKAIRAYCLGCSADSWKEVKLCEMEDCHLYPYRFGKRPRTTTARSSKKTPPPSTASNGE